MPFQQCRKRFGRHTLIHEDLQSAEGVSAVAWPLKERVRPEAGLAEE